MFMNLQIDKKKFILIQFCVFFGGFLATVIFYGYIYAFSYLLGSGVIIIANFIFFIRFLFFYNNQFPPNIEILIFYISAVIKLLLITVGTILAAIYIKPKLFPYIFGLIMLKFISMFNFFIFKQK